MTPHEVEDTLAAFRSLRLLVVGDAMLDRYLSGSATRLAQEAPAPVVDVFRTESFPGGAANVAMNAAALGAKVTLVAAAGQDADCSELRRHLAAAGIRFLRAEGPRTTTKTRVCADGKVLVRVDEGRPCVLPARSERELCAAIEDAWRDCDAVLISDYAYGVVSARVLECLAASLAAAPRILAVDARDLGRYSHLQPAIVKPDYSQALALLGIPATGVGDRPGFIEASAPVLFERTNAATLCVTLDADGSVVMERGGTVHRTLPPRRSEAHVNGAGDTYLAAFTLARAAGRRCELCSSLAAAAAAAVVATPGTAVCRPADLLAQLGGSHTIRDDRSLAGWVAAQRARSARIVFTNGVFDVLHSGHTSYLEEAARLGDVLLVAVNDDASVRRLKGPERPINPVADRMAVLAALESVSAVVAFSEDTPERLLRIVRPDVFVKGGDYSRSRLKEARLVEELGGQVVLAGYAPGHSTTEILARARAAQPVQHLRRAGARVAHPGRDVA